MSVTGVIILAGGTARRLGGISKPDLKVAGRRLLDHQLDQVAKVTPDATVVVVAPPQVRVPPAVVRVLEDPPFGGPVAGFAAGLAALTDAGVTAGLVGLATCDAPLAPANYPDLVAALDVGLDGVAPTTEAADGTFPQYALGVYRLAALTKILPANARNVSVKRTFSPAKLAFIPDVNRNCTDADTWQDVKTLEGLLKLH